MQDWELIRVFASAEICKSDVESQQSVLEAGLELSGDQTRQVLLLGCFEHAQYWINMQYVRLQCAM